MGIRVLIYNMKLRELIEGLIDADQDNQADKTVGEKPGKATEYPDRLKAIRDWEKQEETLKRENWREFTRQKIERLKKLIEECQKEKTERFNEFQSQVYHSLGWSRYNGKGGKKMAAA